MAATRKHLAVRLKLRHAERSGAASTHRQGHPLPGNATLIDSLLMKGISGDANQQRLLQRYLKVKNRYFHATAKQLLGNFLNIKQHQDKSIDEILSYPYSRSDEREFVHILRLFLAGEFDAIHTVKMLDRYHQRRKPLPVRPFAMQRHAALKKFIEGFKTNCMKDMLHDSVAITPYHEDNETLEQTATSQRQSLFPQRVSLMSGEKAKPAASKSDQQRSSLFHQHIMPV